MLNKIESKFEGKEWMLIEFFDFFSNSASPVPPKPAKALDINHNKLIRNDYVKGTNSQKRQKTYDYATAPCQETLLAFNRSCRAYGELDFYTTIKKFCPNTHYNFTPGAVLRKFDRGIALTAAHYAERGHQHQSIGTFIPRRRLGRNLGPLRFRIYPKLGNFEVLVHKAQLIYSKYREYFYGLKRDMSTADATLFEENFTITTYDQSKYDRVARIGATSGDSQTVMTLDINTELYPVSISDNLHVVLATSLSIDGSKEEKGWRDVGRSGMGGEATLADMFEYVCHGKLYKFEDAEDGQTIKAYISFGGLLMAIEGNYKKLTPLRVDYLYLLIKK